MQKNMQKKCTKMPEQKCQKKNLKKGKNCQKKNMSKDETKTFMVGLWNNGSALVLKLEGHGFKSLFRAFVFSS